MRARSGSINYSIKKLETNVCINLFLKNNELSLFCLYRNITIFNIIRDKIVM